MNIDIEKPSFKQLVLLNMQQLTNFPYIEKDFDAITDYQLLCKVVEYLNDVITNQNITNDTVLGLYNAFITLKDYIDNYFKNLDVQDEINNKLDEMAQSGQLNYIISSYVDPIYQAYEEQINQNIDDIEESLNNYKTTTNSTLSTQANEINTLKTRVDSFTNLTEGSTTGDAELIDGRTSYSGLKYTNIGDAIRGQVNILLTKEERTDSELLRHNEFDGIYKQGLYNSSTGEYDGTRNDYVCNENSININGKKNFKFLNWPANIPYINVLCYKSDDTFISKIQVFPSSNPLAFPDNTSYINFCFTKGSTQVTKPTDYNPVFLYFDNWTNSTGEILKNTLKINGIDLMNFQNFIYFYNQGNLGISTNRIGIIKMIKLSKDIKISCESGYAYSIAEFNEFREYPSLDNQKTLIQWATGETILPKDTCFTINFKKVSEANIYPEECVNLHFEEYTSNESSLGNDYSIDNVMNKKNIELTQLGQISGWQSFCLYNDKLYCTDGSKIYVYNKNTFIKENEVSINVGHGNSMQLGHNGLCYISGWNDNNIYVIDLNNLSLVNTISIPSSITGYSTACVDDLNNIAYIFNAPTPSSSGEVNYTFIAYNYSNNTILYTKILDKFGAMQSCDFLNGKIIALNGLGNSFVPNHFRYYDTLGNITGEYIINSYSSSEPEGVCIERETNDVYISLGSYVYKISQ